MKFLPNTSSQMMGIDTTRAYEYDFNDSDLNLARIELNGRYPDKGYATNTKVKMACYVMQGSGSLTVEGSLFELESGDACIIEPGERYFWDAEMILLITSTPPWNKEQASIEE